MSIKNSRKIWSVIAALSFCMTSIFPYTAQAGRALEEKAAASAQTVRVVNPAGSNLTLDADNPVLEGLSGTTGKIVFDAKTGTLTVDSATGFQRVQAPSGSLTVVLKGDSVMNCTGSNVLAAQNGNLTVRGDGSLEFSCNAQAISAKYDITIAESVKLKGTVKAADQPVVYTTGGNIRFEDDVEAVLQTPEKGTGILNSNPQDAGVYISDNAKVSVAGYLGIRIGNNKSAGTSATLSITENAVVNLQTTNRAAFINQYSGSILVRDHASLTAESSGENTLYLNGLGPACVEISGNAAADIAATGPRAAINLLGYGVNSLLITTKNTVNVEATVSCGKNNVWGAISMWASQSGNHNNVLIQDAMLNVTNTLSQTAADSIVTALYVTGTPGKTSLTIGGDAKVNLTAVNNSSADSAVCDAVGLRVTPGVDVVVRDSAKLTAIGEGAASGGENRGGGIYLGSSLRVSDGAEVIAQAKGTASSGILMDSASEKVTLTAEERAVLRGISEKGYGINAYNDNENGSALSFQGGILSAIGGSTGIGSASSNMEFILADNAVVKAGADESSLTVVEKPDFVSKYILLETERIKVNEILYTGFVKPEEGTAVTDSIVQDMAGALQAADAALYRLDAAAAALQKKNGSSWESVAAGDQIIAGEYRLIVRVGIDGENGKTHVLSQDAVMRVDDEEWEAVQPLEIGNDDSWGTFAVAFTIDHTKHTGGEATCSAKAICTICGNPYGELNPSNHKNTELRDALPATEEAEGYTGDTWCTDCNKKIADGQVIDRLTHIHSLVKTEEKQATCTQDGNKAHYTCEKCGKLYQDAEGLIEIQRKDVVIAAGHNYSADWKYDAENHWHECGCGDKTDTGAHDAEVRNAVDAKPGEKGYTGDKICRVCGYVIETGKEIPAEEADDNIPQTGTAGGAAAGVAFVLIFSLGTVLIIRRHKQSNADEI